jgi:uncharacterized membrane protein HdeD (DUF308 family)
MFQPGYNKQVKWALIAGAPTAINVTEHKWSEWINFLDVTHSGSGGVAMGLASYLQGDGNVKANSDDAQVITSVIGVLKIMAGAAGVLSFYHYSFNSNAFVVPATVTKVNFSTVIAGVCFYDFDIKLNGLNGIYQRPQ